MGISEKSGFQVKAGREEKNNGIVQLNFVYQVVHQLQLQNDKVSGWAARQIVPPGNDFKFFLTLMMHLLKNFHELIAGFHMS